MFAGYELKYFREGVC